MFEVRIGYYFHFSYKQIQFQVILLSILLIKIFRILFDVKL